MAASISVSDDAHGLRSPRVAAYMRLLALWPLAILAADYAGLDTLHYGDTIHVIVSLVLFIPLFDLAFNRRLPWPGSKRWLRAAALTVLLLVPGFVLAYMPNLLRMPPEPFELRAEAAPFTEGYFVHGLSLRYSLYIQKEEGVQGIERKSTYRFGRSRLIDGLVGDDGLGNHFTVRCHSDTEFTLQDDRGGYIRMEWAGKVPTIVDSKSAGWSDSARAPTPLGKKLGDSGIFLLWVLPVLTYAVLAWAVSRAYRHKGLGLASELWFACVALPGLCWLTIYYMVLMPEPRKPGVEVPNSAVGLVLLWIFLGGLSLVVIVPRFLMLASHFRKPAPVRGFPVELHEE